MCCANNKQEVELLPPRLLEEAEVLEFPREHHNPNLARYHGCKVSRNPITGTALERYKVILGYRYEEIPHDLGMTAAWMVFVQVVKHVHSLGLAHNDLNPTGIALDEDDNPTILDFGSCKIFGEALLSAACLAG